MSPQLRTIVLVIDVIALLGVVGFSVGAAVERENTAYLVGQMVCAALVLVSVVILRRLPPRKPSADRRDVAPGRGDQDDG